VEIIPPRLKEPAYRLYEMRLRQELARSKSQLPRHIAVLCDGNRRWARDAGHDDVSYGYRMGAAKIAEMLRWCADAGIEMATVYLLSTENLQRDPDELSCLIEIITDVVDVTSIALFFRPVYAFEYLWRSKSKTQSLEIDGVTGESKTTNTTVGSRVTRHLSKELLFDIGADAVDLLVPGGGIALKVGRAVIRRSEPKPS